MRHFLTACLTIALLALSVPAQAAGPATATPGTLRINDKGTSVVTIRWAVGSTFSVPTAATLSSPVGELIIGGPTVATPGGLLSRSFAHAGLGTETIRFSERIRITRAQAREIASGVTGFYRRTFDDGAGTVTVDIPITVTGSGALSILNFDLRFDDDSLQRVVGRDAALTARMRLTTAGQEVFDGTWQVAGPTGQGTAFRTLDRVRKVISGSRTTIFESPQLPTSQPGLYRVRFVPGTGADPNFAGSFPELRYTVSARAATPLIALDAPAPGASATSATLFDWQPVQGASLYRLEFLGSGAGGAAGPRVAALDTDASQARLKPFTLARIAASGPVFWRVVAFDTAGNTLSVSALRRLSGATTRNAKP